MTTCPGFTGYSMTIAKVNRKELIIQGAPRDHHMGKVIISDSISNETLDSPEVILFLLVLLLYLKKYINK